MTPWEWLMPSLVGLSWISRLKMPLVDLNLRAVEI